jgi:hypothetical protein
MTTTKTKTTIGTVNPETEFTVTTSNGKVFVYRELDALEEFRLNSLLGSADALNRTTAYHALIAVGVRKIDGTRWDFPENRFQMEQAIVRLGKDGFAAVSDKMIDRASSTDPEKDLEAAGNLPNSQV